MPTNKSIILVSSSPRRKQLMKDMKIDFRVDPKTHFLEVIPDGMDPEDVPSYFAEQKSKHYHKDLSDNDVLVSADTVVICDGIIMGKPHHRNKAKEMLRSLSGKTHKVVSAVCVRTKGKCITKSDTALVTFRELEDEEIDSYVKKSLPVDKAGGYGIQEWIGLVGVTRIEGSFYTVMGLPTHLLYRMLQDIR